MGTPEHVAADSLNNQESSQSEIDYEKRFKDTQAAFTKSQQELKALQAKAKMLEELTAPPLDVDEATKAELDDLKFSDPEAWRAKINTLEQEAIRKHNERLNAVSAEAIHALEIERRAQVLKEFNASHKLNITDETIQFDVPPRITKKLESGEITFEVFLNEVKEYLNAPKAIGDGNTTLNQPNLSSVGGDGTPSDVAANKDIAASYSKIVF